MDLGEMTSFPEVTESWTSQLHKSSKDTLKQHFGVKTKAKAFGKFLRYERRPNKTHSFSQTLKRFMEITKNKSNLHSKLWSGVC